MISPIQNTDTSLLPSKPVNPRASEFYTQGSSFHDLFTAPDDATPTKAAATLNNSTLINLVPAAPVAAASTRIPLVSPASLSTASSAEAAADPTFEQGAVVTGPDGSTTPLNSLEMASADTAQQIAAKLGGTVTSDVFAGGFTTSADIREIAFTGSNVKINAGIAASLFAMYGDAPGSQAWRTINNDLGRDPMATGPVS